MFSFVPQITPNLGLDLVAQQIGIWFLGGLHQRSPVNVKSDRSAVLSILCGHGRPSHPLHTADPGVRMLSRNPRGGQANRQSIFGGSTPARPLSSVGP
jgi:hypothetical protein